MAITPQDPREPARQPSCQPSCKPVAAQRAVSGNNPRQNPCEKRNPRQKQNARKRQDRLIGYAVLGVGCLALLVVGAIAYSRYMPVRSSLPRDLAGQEQVFTKDRRAPRLTASRIDGNWEAAFADYNAVFQANDGFYRILAWRSYDGAPRRYVSGRYELDGSVMTLIPDDTLAVPAAGEGEYRYFHLGRRVSEVDIRFDHGGMVWFAGIDPDRAHMLIGYSGQDHIYWMRSP